jgi:DNA-binding NarL/FixJ family response regulator
MAMQAMVQIGAAAAGVVVVLLAMMVWMRAQQRAAVDRLEDRVSHLAAGLSLLTDTTETGLRDIALELSRLSAAASAATPKPRAVTQRRMAGAARRGRSVQDIAAEEQVSEGEVRLRLELEKSRKEGSTHAQMR